MKLITVQIIKKKKKRVELIFRFTKDKAFEEGTKYKTLTTYMTDLYNISKAAYRMRLNRYTTSPTVVSIVELFQFLLRFGIYSHNGSQPNFSFFNELVYDIRV